MSDGNSRFLLLSQLTTSSRLCQHCTSLSPFYNTGNTRTKLTESFAAEDPAAGFTWRLLACLRWDVMWSRTLRLIMWLRMASNSQFSCLPHPSAGITDMWHPSGFVLFLIDTFKRTGLDFFHLNLFPHHQILLRLSKKIHICPHKAQLISASFLITH